VASDQPLRSMFPNVEKSLTVTSHFAMPISTIFIPDNVDQNLGLKYFLNGALASNIVIDTSAAATDTIEYVATDNAGNTARSTRTVIIVAPATPEPAPAP